jgi:uncharacterized protein VirK/YbjX
MIIKDMNWLWANSAAVCDGHGFVVATRRVRFVVRALAVYGSISPMINAPRNSPLGRLMERRPETVGAVIWPYQCLGWDARTRLARIRDHYSVLEIIGGPLNFPVDGKLSLLDLHEIREGLHVVLDQPKWFMREGQLTINLFLRDTRMFSLAFSLCYQENRLSAFIGSIQGRDIEGALAEYRELTKAAQGMRPRDLLIEVFRMLCAVAGVTDIFAVSNEHRHHRGRYFGNASKKFSVNYDEIWTDRGGVRVDPMFFQFRVDGQQRDLDSMPAKKRGMYRRRYDMLKSIRQKLHDNYCRLAAVENKREIDYLDGYERRTNQERSGL